MTNYDVPNVNSDLGARRGLIGGGGRSVRIGLRVFAVAAVVLVALVGLMVNPEKVSAQETGCDGWLEPTYVHGPWVDIKQIFWVNQNPNEDLCGLDDDNRSVNYSSRVHAVGQRQEQCWPTLEGGELKRPRADRTNAHWLVLQCRIGRIVTSLTWVGVSLLLVALVWNGFLLVVDSGGSDERYAQIRGSLVSPMVGVGILFFSYVFAKMLYLMVRYNFSVYIVNNFTLGER